MFMLESDLIRRVTQEKILRKDKRGNWEEIGAKTVPTGIPIARVIKNEYGKLLAAAPELLNALEQCESLLSELEQGGAKNPELQIARDAIALAKD